MTIEEAVRAGVERLTADEHLRPSARRDAEMLVMHMLGLGRAAMLAHPERELTDTETSALLSSIARRVRHEPVQYITGTQEFYGLAMAVTPAVLIPRPETELLVEAVLERLPPNRPTTILDVGTGSGAIAIALAAHLPLAVVTAVDMSEAALDVAHGNARAHRVEGHVRFVLSDLLKGLRAEEQREGFDAVVSNPPYVPLGDRTVLHPQVREYEPAAALFAGDDGLEVYRRLIPEARAALKPGGLLALEMGHGQRDALATLLKGWREVQSLDDLQGIPRVALARK